MSPATITLRFKPLLIALGEIGLFTSSQNDLRSWVL